MTHATLQIRQDHLDVLASDHAARRKQQRGISDQAVELVLKFGRYVYQSGRKTYSVSLDKKGIQALRRRYGQVKELSKLRNMYLILSSDNVLVTCAYRD